jgi:hypothetical protein
MSGCPVVVIALAGEWEARNAVRGRERERQSLVSMWFKGTETRRQEMQ